MRTSSSLTLNTTNICDEEISSREGYSEQTGDPTQWLGEVISLMTKVRLFEGWTECCPAISRSKEEIFDKSELFLLEDKSCWLAILLS